MTDLRALREHADDPVDLLQDWFNQWLSNDDMPSKMHGSLHIRTALTLLALGRITDSTYVPLKKSP